MRQPSAGIVPWAKLAVHPNQSILVWTLKTEPFMLCLPFDRLRANGSGPIMVGLSNHKLRVNGDNLPEEYQD